MAQSLQIIDQENWKLYEYMLDVTIRIPGKKDYKLNDIQIEGIYLEKDYDNDHLPVLMLDTNIPKLVEAMIIKNKNDVTFTLNFTNCVKDTDDLEAQYDKKTVFSGVFTPIIPDTTPDQEKTLRKLLKEADGKTDEFDFSMDDMANKVTFILIKKETSIAAKTIVNAVIPNVTLLEATSFLLSKAGCKNVLMSSLDNTDIISELVLLPIPMLSELEYLINYYGFHKEGTQVFMDFDTTYINRMGDKCTAWKRNEPKTVNIFISEAIRGRAAGGSFEKGNEVYISIDQDSYTVIDGSQALDQIEGQNVTLLNEDTTQITNISGGGEFTTVKSVTGHNKYIDSITALRKKESTRTIQIFASNIDMTELTPNKQYNVITNDSEIIDDITGTFRISSMSLSVLKQAGKFMPLTSVTLKRVSES